MQPYTHQTSVNTGRPAPIFNLRDLPIDADPPERRREPARLRSTIARLMERRGARVGLPLDDILKEWPLVAGERLAARLTPGKLDGGVLYLYTSSSAELFEIRRFELPRLEKALRENEVFADIRQIRLQLKPSRG